MDLFEHAKERATKRTRRDEIEDAAKAYLLENREVWRLFVKFTKERIDDGFKHYGAAQIFGRIRWETDKPTEHGGSTFKVNSNYCPHFARWFMNKNPQHAGFFRTRELKSDNQPALGLPPLGSDDFPTTNSQPEAH